MPAFCPNCGKPVAESAKFCAHCGFALEQRTAVDTERQARISASAPRALAEKMRSASGGERKTVTCLFADIVGSTTLAERMDPEDWTEIVNEAFDHMTSAIYRYEGTVARLMGDAVLAFFGAPVTHEDDPERAARAGLDMVAAIEDQAAVLARRHGIDFAIRVGINTGPVVVGNVGTDLAYEYTAMGDAVNVAARMQSAARPRTVLITQATYRFIAPIFDAITLDPIAVKGKTEPVQAYEVVGLKAAPSRTRGIAGLESPMVGREEELRSLVALVDVVASGRGRVACVIAEPGIGKSRLLAELKRRALEREGVTWIEGRCLSYGQKLAYHLLLDVVRSFIGVPASAPPDEVRTALDERLGEMLGGATADTRAYLGHLLSLPLPEGDLAKVRDLEPSLLQTRYIAALRQVVGAASVRGPLILVLEDVHWADQSSVEALSQLMALVYGDRVLMIAASRPDRNAPGWKLVTDAERSFGESLTEIRLAPLLPVESRRLVSNLLEIESLPEHVRDFILAKAEGNPFFVEEVIRMLIDRGAIVRDGPRWIATKEIDRVEIPETLQGLLLARIDRLSDESKRCIRVASVVGRQFPARVVERVMEAIG